MKTRPSWRQKLEKEQEPTIVDVPPKMARTCGTGKMLIPRPLDVDALMRRVEKGRIVTQSQIREKLAKDSGADVACPITTGIFIRIAAEAAEEDLSAGKSQVTPYWRVVKDGGSLNERLPGGADAQSGRLMQEGAYNRAGKRQEAAKGKGFRKAFAAFVVHYLT